MGITVTVAAALTPLAFRTRTCTAPESPKGSCAFTCPPDTKNSGTACPFTSTVVPSRLFGNGTSLAATSFAARLLPNTASTIPGAIAAL